MYTPSQIKKLITENKIADFYNDWFWRKLSKQIIKEQHYECQYCKEKKKHSRATMVHHVKHLRRFPELAYSRYYYDQYGQHKQLVATCHECHEEQHPDRFHKNDSKRFISPERF